MFKTLILAVGLSLCSLTQANVALEISDSSQKPLQSLELLQSLYQLTEKFEYPLPQVQDLPNPHQVRTLFVEAPQLPIVDLQLSFNAGSARDEEIGQGLFGLANMAAKLMLEGTDKYSALDVANILEDQGAQLTIQAHRDMFVVKLRVLSDPKKITAATQLVLDLIQHAHFKKQSIDLILNNTAVGQQQLLEHPSRLMNVHFYRALYGTHPYAQPMTGTQASIQRISPHHLQQFRDRFLVRNNLNISITGQLNREQALALSHQISAQLTAGEKAQPLQPLERPSSLQIVHIPYQSTQAHVMLGHIGTVRDDPDRLALEIANRMLGNSSFNSLLMQELRVKRGYTYGVTSQMTFPQSQGIFSIYYSTQQQHLIDSVAVTYQSLLKFIQQPIDPQLLTDTKLGMLRAFPAQFGSNALLNAQLGAIGFYQESAQTLQDYPQRLQQITVQQIQDAIQRHLDAKNLTIIILSPSLDQAQLQQQLTSIANLDEWQENGAL